MIYNICRPIVLYNDFLPPDDKPHDKWHYIAFGYFDGIKIGENIFQNGKCSLEELWNYDVEQTRELEGRYSSQIIYGFRSEENNEICDSEFWEQALSGDTEYPFIFVTLIQGRIDKRMAEIGQREALEKELSENNKRKAITYLTLDNNSMVLVLLCREYEDGADLIDGFHRRERTSPLKKAGIKLFYSYTVAAAQKIFLNGPGIERLKEKKVERVYIYAIERQPGSIEYIRRELYEKGEKLVRKESILGCNDEVIIIEDMLWREFLAFFRDVEGKLNHSCEEYRHSFIGLTTIITSRQNDEGALGVPKEELENLQKEAKKELEKLKESDSFEKTCRRMGERLRELICVIREKYQGLSSGTLERYLHQITNALQKFENTPVSDYVYYSMYLPIHMVLQIAKETENINNAYFHNAFYEFIKGLNLSAQNSVRSDRQFTQSMDLDIRIYNAPVQLNAFYNAFLYYMKKFLAQTGECNCSGHKYEFLTCLGVTSNVQVKELFKNMSDDKRLFLVSVPENQVYDIKLMLIMLSHEVGHFVGQTVRNREFRYECAVNIVANIVSRYFKIAINAEYADIQNEEYWTGFTFKLEKFIREQMDNLESKEYLEEYKFTASEKKDIDAFCKMHQKYQYYTHWLRETLLDSVNEVLINKKGELFGYLQEMEYLRWMMKDASRANERQREFAENAGKMIQNINGYFIWNTKRFSVESAVDMMIIFFKECEADLIAVLTLELSLEDYLYAIWKSAFDQGLPDWRLPAEMVIRSGLVINCMVEKSYDDMYSWTDMELKKIDLQNHSGIKEMMYDIQNFLQKYFKQGESGSETASANVTVELFLDSKVLKWFADYLRKCRESFQEALKEGAEGGSQLRQEQESLMKIYRMNRENAEELVWNIQGYIGRYRQCLQKDFEKCGKEI